jgi:2-dehydropantoate 2-reductase
MPLPDELKGHAMQIAVMGAGAVGCWHGGMLARAGHAVTLIGRAPHVQAMQRDGGLLLDTSRFQARVAVQASTEAAAARGAQLVLVCVKSADTEAAGAALAPQLAPDASVFSLQNGVDNAARLQAVLQTVLRYEVVPAAVYVAAEMAGPGHVKHHGRGELVIGPSAASDAIAALFSAAGVPVEVSANVLGALWAKLLLNCAWNALSAITQQPYGRLAQREGVQALQRDLMDECLAVARAEGVTLPGDAQAQWQAIAALAHTMPDQRSSTAQDLARGRATEIDHLNGHVLRRGQAHGIPTPANRALHTLVKLLEPRPAASR